MSIELKIKAKHLALEPDVIRHEEYKLKEQIKHLKGSSDGVDKLNYKLNSLITHRRGVVCNEARATHLARTYLSGKPYLHAEKKRKEDREFIFQRLVIPRITAMVKKYGHDVGYNVSDKVISEWAKL